MQSTDSLKDEEGRAAALAYLDATLNEMLKEKKVLRFSVPNDNDVLCGRGHFTNYHQGNSLLRSLVKAIRVNYVMSLKKDKKVFSEFIVRRISAQDPPGRFLKKDPKTDTWFDIGHKKALIKVRQALRDGANNISKAEIDKAKNKHQRKIASHSGVETEEFEEALVEIMKKTPSKSWSNIPCNSDRIVTSSVEKMKKTPSKSSSNIPCNSDRIGTSSVEKMKKTPSKTSSNIPCNSDRLVTSSVEKIKKTPPKLSSDTSCNSDRFAASSKCTRLYYTEEVYSSEFIPTD